MTVFRIGWKHIGSALEPGRYRLSFGWVTVTADDLQIWSQFRQATFALYEVPGEAKEEYRLGSVELNIPASDPAP